MASLPSIPVSTLTNTGLALVTQAQWQTFMTAVFQGLYGTDIVLTPDSPDGQLMNIFIQVVLDSQELTRQVYTSFDPNQAFGVTLDQRLGLSGVIRLGGTFSLVNITVTASQGLTLFGLDQTVQPVYTIADSSGNQWQLQSTLTVSSGTNPNVIFQAASPGAINASPSTIINQVTVAPGVTSVTNPAGPYFVGVSEESDAAAKIRRQISQQAWFTQLYTALGNISGVSSIIISENDSDSTDDNGTPAHSIWVIIGGNPASSAVANAIYQARNAGCGMRGDTSFVVTRKDGSPFTINWDVVTSLPAFAQFFVQSIDGVNAPKVALIASSLENVLVPGVGQTVNINELSTLVQSIDPNSLITFSSNSYMPSNGGLSLTDASFGPILVPTALNNQITVDTADTIVYPMILQGVGVVVAVSGPAVTTTVSIVRSDVLQLSVAGGYSGGGGYSYALTTHGSGTGTSVDADTGLYTAGASAGVDVVTITDGNSQTAHITITVT